ncbi:hypothetical protein SUGI_0893390 [Cryptomeria japonica]|nr:hypothetical protein SUGI_0893390 [Cryptomeria japonica]
MVNITLNSAGSGFIIETLGDIKSTNTESKEKDMNSKCKPISKPTPREIPTLEFEEGKIDCSIEGISEIPSLMDQDIPMPPMGDQNLLKWSMEDHSKEKTFMDCPKEIKQSFEKDTQPDTTHESDGFEPSPISPLILDTMETEEEYARRITEENKIILEYVGNETVNDLTDSFINEVADDEELAYQRRLLMSDLL